MAVKIHHGMAIPEILDEEIRITKMTGGIFLKFINFFKVCIQYIHTDELVGWECLSRHVPC